MDSSVPEVHPTEVLKHQNEGYQLIDVRSEEEFHGELSHIPGAQLISIGEPLDSWLKEAHLNEKIIFICRSGGRSSQATSQALRKGLKNVFNMSGGMLLWTSLSKK